jgi:hypothetical protein
MLVLGDEKALAIIAKGTSRSQVHDYAVLLSMILDNHEREIAAWWNWLINLTLTKLKLQVQADANVGGGKESRDRRQVFRGARTGTLFTYDYEKTTVFLPFFPESAGRLVERCTS